VTVSATRPESVDLSRRVWKRSPARRLFSRFLGICGGLIVVCLGLVLCLNMLVDPLWYSRGNILTHKNFMFNERYSKPILFQRVANKYDCVIFGASETVFLRPADITGHTCFNFAFSGGNIREFADYAAYLRAKGFAPRQVIVALNFRSLEPDLTDQSPDFVVKAAAPPGPLEAYLARDVLWHSIKTLCDRTGIWRYSGPDFVERPAPDHPFYRPANRIDPAADTVSFTDANTRYMRQIHAMFPDAELVGYVPLLSAWVDARFHYQGELLPYLHAVYAASREFDRFYDFSIPSFLTENPDNAYDEVHFSIAATAHVAGALSAPARMDRAGLDLKRISFEEYVAAYRGALDDFMREHEIAARQPATR
jgi:hypothetical protein